MSYCGLLGVGEIRGGGGGGGGGCLCVGNEEALGIGGDEGLGWVGGWLSLLLYMGRKRRRRRLE